MNYMIYDLIVLAVLVLFAAWGIHRGLIRSLFSLLAVLVSLVGAILVVNLLGSTVSAWLQPKLQPTVTAAVQAALPEDVADAELSLDHLILLLEEADLPFGLNRFVEEFRTDDTPELTAGSLAEDLAVSLTEKLTGAITYTVLFLLAFLLILLIWHCIGRTLNLVAKLPGLHTLNKAGGLLFGVIRGAALLFICAWVIRQLRSDLIPAEAVEQTKLLHFFMTTKPLEFLANL